jgi:hypothetical protein
MFDENEETILELLHLAVMLSCCTYIVSMVMEMNAMCPCYDSICSVERQCRR